MKAFRRVAFFLSIGSAAIKVNDAEEVLAKVIKWCIDLVSGLTSALYLKIRKKIFYKFLKNKNIYIQMTKFQPKLHYILLYTKKKEIRSRYVNSVSSSLVRFCLFCVACNTMYFKLRRCTFEIYTSLSTCIYFSKKIKL
jgi:hypothetical protein